MARGGDRREWVRKALESGRIEASYYDLAGPYMRTVKFERITPMQIPCSWMPGGFVQVGGSP
jgi:hypothetical protein